MQIFNQTPEDWDRMITRLPLPHLLQTWEWSLVKAKYGWQPTPLIWRSANDEPVAAAMVLKRSLPVGGFARRMGIMYIPKGPHMDWSDVELRRRVLGDLQSFAHSHGAIFIKIDPDVELGKGIPGSPEEVEEGDGLAVQSDLKQRGWSFSHDQVQFRNTVMIDLTASEDEMLARMKQKTRYNVRLAAKKGVHVRSGTAADLPLVYKMYAETSIRDEFVIREEAYYQAAWQIFMGNPLATIGQQPSAEVLIAEVSSKAVAAVSIFYFAGVAYYLYGMSSDEHREKMPNYLLQWEAMRRAKALGCTCYNLWGAPDRFDESDLLWGVFRFKEGLGGYVLRTIGAWDLPTSPLLYKLYTQTLPRVLDIMRLRGRRRIQQSIGG
jgi:peptidoglycan pentaglycine glycine transferase (the first glycine)